MCGPIVCEFCLGRNKHIHFHYCLKMLRISELTDRSGIWIQTNSAIIAHDLAYPYPSDESYSRLFYCNLEQKSCGLYKNIL